MKTRRTFALLVLTILAVAGSWPARGTDAAGARAPIAQVCQPSQPAPAGGAAAPLAAAGNTFGFALFHRLFAGHERANTFISPTSIALALEMVYDGARGATRAAMARVLGLGGLSPDAVNRDAAALIDSLQRGEPTTPSTDPMHGSSPPTRLQIANSLWSDVHIPISQQFIADAQRYFGARAAALEMNAPSAKDTINAWVSCATSGKIKQIVQSTRDIAMFLLNAVYFQGSWTNPFDPGRTQRQTFTLPSGSTNVRMMHMTHYFSYYQGSDFQVITLPYGLHQRFNMVVVLPRRGLSLAQFAPRLTRAAWGYWIKKLGTSTAYVSLAMPHVDLKYGHGLKAPLKAMGMRVAFTPLAADLSGICSLCYISQALHKTFLHIDEKGTTAAAVTAIGITSGGGAPPPPPVPMIVDHPFFLGIRDSHTGAVLFLGAVNQP